MINLPGSMATQHPDNADRYIPIQNEPDEAISALTPLDQGGMGIEEIMIDFEGKLTPYHQTSQIALGLINKGIIPGEHVRITPRIPNSKKEPVFRQLMSIMSLVETNTLAYRVTGKQAITETVVPMTETGAELVQLQERINSVIELGNKNYDISFPLNSIRIIPLVESVPALVNVDHILEEYYSGLKSKNIDINQIRIMFARSDSAMSYGMLSSVFSLLIAISKVHKWSETKNVGVFPVLGCGALPFRGHLTEKTIDSIMKNYAGIYTFTVQSGIRYDHSPDSVRKVVEKLKNNPYRNKPVSFNEEDTQLLKTFIGISTKHYMRAFVEIIDSVEKISKFIPRNRDRLSAAKSGMGYIREITDMREIADLVNDPDLKKELMEINTDVSCSVPRAISFTATLYTLGMPPEFIGTGRCLREISEKYGQEGLDKVFEFFPQLTDDLKTAMQYVNVKISRGIISEAGRKLYMEDIESIRSLLDISPESEEATENSFYHTLLKSIHPILLHLTGKQDDLISDNEEENKILKEWITKMGKIRGSLG